MISRDELRAILEQHFPDASATARAGAVDAIAQSIGDWDDVTGHADLDQRFAFECAEVTYLADQLQRGADFRVLRRRAPQADIHSGLVDSGETS